MYLNLSMLGVTERDDTIKGDGNDSTFPLPRGTEGSDPSSSSGEMVWGRQRGDGTIVAVGH